VLNAAQSLIGDSAAVERPVAKPRKGRRGMPAPGADAVQVQGVGNLLNHIAGCCRPLPGDNILGFITQGRGVSIHRRDCGRLLNLQAEHPERIIEVNWGEESRAGYEVDIGIEAYDRAGLLRDITELLAAARVKVLTVNTDTDRREHLATMRLRVEVPDLSFLGKLLHRISGLNNVISAVRLSDSGVERAG
jgi:GTP pyrophosphokinase